jgi:hypothetical protein
MGLDTYGCTLNTGVLLGLFAGEFQLRSVSACFLGYLGFELQPKYSSSEFHQSILSSGLKSDSGSGLLGLPKSFIHSL